MAYTSNRRTTGPGKWLIEIGQKPAGWPSGPVDGGHAVGDVITEKLAGDWLERKHLGNVKYEDISFDCGTGMSNELYDWINTGFNQSFNGPAGRKDGAVISADYDYKEISRLNWFNGILSEFSMPALDGASKDAAKMKIKITPETTRKVVGSGGSILGSGAQSNAAKQKKWTCANFALRIDGISEENLKRVSKIDAITVKQKTVEHQVGEMRDYEKEAVSVQIPNLVITIAESHAEEFYKWHEDFVVKGNCGQDAERGGHLDYLQPNMDPNALFTLTFFNLGIFKMSPEKVEAGQESIRKVKVEMYCEDVRFKYNSAATIS